MQIEKLNNESVLITTNNASIYLNLSNKPLKVANPENSIVLGVGDKTSGYVINEPGEYELYDITIVALENSEKMQGIADFFQVEAEGTIVSWQLDPNADISKEKWENLADTHLLVLDAAADLEDTKLGKFISKHNPHKLLVLNIAEAEVEKLVGIPVKESGKKFKFTNKDFAAEEYTTECLLLA